MGNQGWGAFRASAGDTLELSPERREALGRLGCVWLRLLPLKS